MAGLSIAIGAGLAYACAIVTARLSYDHGANLVTIAAARYSLLACVLWLLLRASGERLNMPARVVREGLLAGVIAVVTTATYLASVAYIPVSLGTLLFYTHPLVTVFLASWFLGVRSNRMEIVATVVATVGLAVVLRVSFESLNPVGLACAAVASITAAVVFVMSSRTMRSVDPMRYTLLIAVAAALVACGAALIPGMASVPHSAAGWSLLGASVGFNVFGLLGMFLAVRHIGPVATPMVLNLEPVTASVLAVVVIGETLTATQWSGAAVVIGSVLVAQASRMRRGS